jgi:glyoxylase-like metal-dependent hydrolase (beta-lactamase superfamily II)
MRILGMKKIVTACLMALSFTAAVQAHETTVETTRIYTMDCGDIAVSDMDVFSSSGDYAKTKALLGNTCYLIRHKKGDLIWDTGLPADLVGKDPMTNGVFTVSLKRSVVAQLDDIHMIPSEIEYVSISHSHFDHIGQIADFKESVWLISDKEEKAINADKKLSPVLEGFTRKNRKIFTGDYDVFGDGSVMILDMPGHTAGHTVLKVELEKTGTVLLSGDMYHQAKSRELKRVPRFNHDEKVTRKSMERFEKIAKETSAKVILQHEKMDIKKLPKLPEYLE